MTITREQILETRERIQMERIAAMHLSGHSVAEMYERMYISGTTLFCLLDRMGIPTENKEKGDDMTITWKQILEIRKRYASPKEIRPTQWDLAVEYGISQPQVSLIVNNKVYKTPEDIPLPPYVEPIDHPQAETLVTMYLSNVPTAKILQALRMSSTTMYRLLREMDIPLRNKSRNAQGHNT